MSEPLDRDPARADELRLGELLRAVEAPAPAPLRAQIAQINAAAASRRRLGRPAFALGGAVAAAAVAVIIVVLAVGSAAAPTALRTAQLALARPSAPAPASLTAAGTDIAFPDWSARGWPSSGVRHDRLDGRRVTTEFYRSSAAGTVGYAIVSGSPLRYGAGGRTVTRAHGEYVLLRSGGAQVVAWVQDGHTCVLASRTASAPTLLALAVAQDGGPSTVSARSPWGASPQPAAPV